MPTRSIPICAFAYAVSTPLYLCLRGQYLSVPLLKWSIPTTYLCLCLSGQYLSVPSPKRSILICAFAQVVNTYLCLCLSHHHHQSLNREGRWGTTDDFAISFLHFSLFSTALLDLANSRPAHSLMFPPLPLSAFSSSPFYYALQDGFGQTL